MAAGPRRHTGADIRQLNSALHHQRGVAAGGVGAATSHPVVAWQPGPSWWADSVRWPRWRLPPAIMHWQYTPRQRWRSRPMHTIGQTASATSALRWPGVSVPAAASPTVPGAGAWPAAARCIDGPATRSSPGRPLAASQPRPGLRRIGCAFISRHATIATAAVIAVVGARVATPHTPPMAAASTALVCRCVVAVAAQSLRPRATPPPPQPPLHHDRSHAGGVATSLAVAPPLRCIGAR